jgi:N-methylhydantoinase B
VEGDGHKHRPWGFDDGADGNAGQLLLVPAKGEQRTLVSKVPYQKVAKGDRLVVLGPSGGGYGEAFVRDPAAVLDDVLDGYISEDFARQHYGVVIAGGQIDEAQTARLRSDLTDS